MGIQNYKITERFRRAEQDGVILWGAKGEWVGKKTDEKKNFPCQSIMTLFHYLIILAFLKRFLRKSRGWNNGPFNFI